MELLMAKSFNQRASQRQERRAAASIFGKVTPASGAVGGASFKGDVRKQFESRIECKTTSHASYSLKLTEWQKIQSEAAVMGEAPAMQIEFQAPGGFNTKLAVIPWSTYLELRSRDPR
jgi:hypothetical protein